MKFKKEGRVKFALSFVLLVFSLFTILHSKGILAIYQYDTPDLQQVINNINYTAIVNDTYVPYTGATADVNLGSWDLITDTITSTNGVCSFTNNGSFWATGQVFSALRLVSTVATGSAPFTCNSTTLSTNLNADMTDGYHLNQNVLTTSSPLFVGLNVNGSGAGTGQGAFGKAFGHGAYVNSIDLFGGITIQRKTDASNAYIFSVFSVTPDIMMGYAMVDTSNILYLHGEKGVIVKGLSSTTAVYVDRLNSGHVILDASNDIEFRTTTTFASRLISKNTGRIGINTTAPDRALEVNSATGINLRLTYNDSNGTAANYADFLVSSAGKLNIDTSGAGVGLEVSPHANVGFLQIGSNLNTPSACDVYIGGHTGGGSRISRIRTGSLDDNADYGFYLDTHYSGSSIAYFGTRNAGTDTDAITIQAGAVVCPVSIKSASYISSDGSAGITATITTAALTGGGAQGSMTFKNGILTAQTQST